MSEARTRILLLELESEHGKTTVVVHDPHTPAQRVFTAGPAPASEVRQALERFGLGSAAANRSTTPPPPSLHPARTQSSLTAGARSFAPPSAVSLTPGGSRFSLTPLSSLATRPSAGAPPDVASTSAPTERLATAIDALIESVLRAGRAALTSSVDEAIASVLATLENRAAPAVRRLLGRLQNSLDPAAPVDETVLMLAALGDLSERLRADELDARTKELAGIEEEGPELGLRRVVEVGRRRERSPVGWETRLVVDTKDGTLYREAGAPERGGLSLGAPGRLLVVNLGSELVGPRPTPIRVFQYEYHPAAPAAELAKALELAPRKITADETVLAQPLALAALPHPVFFAPATTNIERGVVVLGDELGAEVCAADDATPGACEALVELLESGATLRAVTGALRVRAEGITLTPWAALLERAGSLGLVQLAL